jgi:ribulose-phosphate 3-epimerase
MTDNVYFSPSILSANFACLEQEIEAVADAGADWIHVDVMDGHFVPNITMGPFMVQAVKRVTPLPIDVHLMIENPERYIPAFAEAGASQLTVHIEACRHIHRIVQQIQAAGCRAGIAINPGTPPEFLTEILPELDLVLVMTVNPGFSGQKFIPTSMDKIARTARLIEATASKAIIQVDGGISANTLPATYQAGARSFVAASAVFKHSGGPGMGMKTLIQSMPGN